MKISNRDLEKKIKNAVESSTPNILPKLLQDIEGNKGGKEMTTIDIVEREDRFKIKDSEKRNNFLKWGVSIAAVFLMVFIGYFINNYYLPQSVIAFDVNPSIELKVNKSETIIDAIPLNNEGKEVLGEMKLKKVDLDTAVNAIIGSMVKNGYINDIKNSILISVDSKDTEKGVQLQNRLSEDVNNLLNQYKVDGAVLSQTLKDDNRIKELAEKHDISLGKAALIDLLVQENSFLKFEELARLSINDINLLITGQYNIEEISAKGDASSKGYIGEDRAKSIAMKHLGIDSSSIEKTSIKMDYEDGRMIYEVELYTSTGEHEFEIDGVTGRILEYELEGRKSKSNKPGSSKKTSGKKDNISSNNQKYIGSDKARNIALKHLNIKLSQTSKMEIDLEREDGKMIYEVEFHTSSGEHEFEIDAITGKILEYEFEGKKSKNNKSTSASSNKAQIKKPSTQKSNISSNNQKYIGSNAAKDIALKHSKLSESNIRGLEIELEKEDGIMIYEVEFKYKNLEYEYEINAINGKIVDWEMEKD